MSEPVEAYKPRSIRFYADDWLSGTTELTLEEEAAFLRICALTYSKGRPIPDNDHWLAGQCRVSVRRWRSLKARLVAVGKVQVEGGLILQRRCRIEMEKAQSFARKQAENARSRRGNNEVGGANSLKDNRPDLANADARSMPARASPNPIPYLEEDSSSPRPMNGHDYAFVGRVIRLTPADLARWRKSYCNIPDIGAELQSLDDWCAEKRIPGDKWFHVVSGSLAKKHQDAAARTAKTDPMEGLR